MLLDYYKALRLQEQAERTPHLAFTLPNVPALLEQIRGTLFPTISDRLLEAAGEGTKMADHLSPIVRPAFPSSAIISERSSPSRVRFAAPNNGAPLTAPGRSGQNLLRRGKGSLRTAPLAGDHFAAILVPFFAATDTVDPRTISIRERRRR